MTTPNSFTSRYTDRKVSAAQIAAELVCEKTAGKDLPYQFWQSEPWTKFFARQVIFANALLKVYSPEVLLKVIRSLRKINSLGARKFLVPLLEKEQAILDKYKELAVQMGYPEENPPKEEVSPPEIPKTYSAGKSKMNKLRSLDSGN